MGAFPTAMSLTASFMSAILLLGTPAEMYTYGTMYWDIIGGYFLAMASAAYLYTPVFFNLQVTSAYQYLELRFSRAVRTLASLLVTVQLCIYMAIVVYAPALALGQVTGIDVYLAVTGMFLICIFYTALGGMKAVMWTDTLQVLIMGTAMIVLVIKGVTDAGGHQVVWEAAVNGSRVEFFNFSMDPRERHTVWGLVIGGYFTWIALYGTNQAQIQRYVSVPTLKQAQKAIWINFLNLSALMSICCYAGLIVYSKYKDCDPLVSKKIQRADQIIPLFVMETVGKIPGLTGLFIAGVFSGALSTVSSGINALSATALEDFVKMFYPNMKEDAATVVSKLLAVLFGLISFGLVFIAAQMGGVLQAANSIFGMIGGPLLGIFTLGMFFPWSTNKGALTGGIISISCMFWLGIGTNLAMLRGALVTPRLPISIDLCGGNVTLFQSRTGERGGLVEFYRISYIWYSMIGCIIVVVVGLITSFLTGKQQSRQLNAKMISPAVDAAMRKIFSVKFLRRIDWELDTLLSNESSDKLQLKVTYTSGGLPKCEVFN
ncbi:unnamed protein product [Allacma fusca]|uniref:Sodium-coupled monocarboxylate transporter 1 n=1 Tax=Allacma fusca TaxID=39272 RepID=A0A8J2L849_9HEXA|nr:unnamed protein product [Allacma fusca]